MKDKYNILKESPKVSDRELEGFMDFDTLLENNASRQIQNRPKPSYGLLGGILLIGLMVAGWWFWPSKSPVVEETIISEKIKTTPNEKNIPELSPPVNMPNKKIQDNKFKEATVPERTVAIPSKKESPEDLKAVQKSIQLAPKAEQKEIVSDQIAESPSTPKAMEKESPGVKETKNEKPRKAVKEIRTSVAKEDYVFVDAKPIGGTAALYKYINEKLSYPEAVDDKKIQGEVLLSFTINKNGRPENIKVEKSMGNLFDQEAIKVIQEMPDWNPATLNGVPMESKLSIPLFFNPEIKSKN